MSHHEICKQCLALICSHFLPCLAGKNSIGQQPEVLLMGRKKRVVFIGADTAFLLKLAGCLFVNTLVFLCLFMEVSLATGLNPMQDGPCNSGVLRYESPSIACAQIA